ncbi:MAG: iron-containing redox enzyme family protein [Leptospira sp.]|nr:iron-containing redox enzyme family protein [Leptospira sp.]
MHDFLLSLQSDVKEHSVLKHPWLKSREKAINLQDLIYWLSQEYFVSIGFVDWFLKVAAKTSNQYAKIVLVQNIWEELGEGDLGQTHVSILEQFLLKLGIDPKKNEIFPETASYLNDMEDIIENGFYYGLGALGPANEYLLKLEYSKISESYQRLRLENNLPEGKFFQVNLDADEGHSKRLFDLIASVATNAKEREEVSMGNKLALNAREQFYFGLERVSPSIFNVH